MSQNVVTAVNHGTSIIAGGSIMNVISQNASALTVIIVAITGAGAMWINHRNALANERRNEVNERDIKIAIIKKYERDGMIDEAQLIRATMIKNLP
jgi:malic enzyme